MVKVRNFVQEIRAFLVESVILVRIGAAWNWKYILSKLQQYAHYQADLSGLQQTETSTIGVYIIEVSRLRR